MATPKVAEGMSLARDFRVLTGWKDIEYNNPKEKRYNYDEGCYRTSGDDYDTVATFHYKGSLYLLSDFEKVHDNPWRDSGDFPEEIHGIEVNNYYDPLYIRFNDDCSQIKLYRKVTREDLEDDKLWQ